jgi:hypothetical protein
MNFNERRALSNYLSEKLPDYRNEEITELLVLIEDSLSLLEKYEYDWSKLEIAFINNLGESEGREGLKVLKEHLLLYREFKEID